MHGGHNRLLRMWLRGLSVGGPGTQPIDEGGSRGVSWVDPGLQPPSQKGIEMGGRTLAGTQHSFHIWYERGGPGPQP
jgi:hypothetical protein